jgi:hypothetical protein
MGRQLALDLVTGAAGRGAAVTAGAEVVRWAGAGAAVVCRLADQPAELVVDLVPEAGVDRVEPGAACGT